jgi:hypothetical protein
MNAQRYGSSLPALQMGRRKVVRRSTLEQWKQDNEKTHPDVNVQPTTSERRQLHGRNNSCVSGIRKAA